MLPTPPPTTRKKPHCRTCGLPMAGHKRPYGSPVCPPSSLSLFDSPQPKEPPITQVVLGPLRYLAPVEPPSSPTIPRQDVWLKRNPNWGEKSPQRARVPSITGSLTPTVLVGEDKHMIRDTKPMDNKFDDGAMFGFDASERNAADPHALMSHIAELREPMVTIFGAKQEDIPRIRKTAMRLGVYSAVVPRGAPPERTKDVERKHSLWVILGRMRGSWTRSLICSEWGCRVWLRATRR
ncbi:hypothetical protein BD779DRAFT_328460 [Infundibulicybe gibba]|nr:hypothetical protein BD779DRAFT_328460 [Infundibulicybe gibba]